MPQPRPPGNLKEQCLRSIIKNIDSYWCQDYIKNWLEGSKNLMYVLGPFEDLPSPLIELVIEKLNKSGKLRKHHLHLLLLHHLERLVLCRSTSDFGYILSLLPMRCKKLCHLGLKGRNMPRKLLDEVFMSLSLLQTVDLSQTNVTDETLSVIASYCKHIRVLNLSDTDVTDRSISSLCCGVRRVGIDSTEKPDISKSLIKLDLHGTVVTPLGIQCALMDLPNLQEITHSMLMYAVAKLQMRQVKMAEFVSDVERTVSKIRPLKIRLLQSDEFGKGNVLVADAQFISPAINLCPRIQYVHLRDLSNVKTESLFPLLSLNEVIDLVLQFNEYEHVDFDTQIVPLLHMHGKTLHNLQLHSVQNINITVIACLCTKLQTLELDGCNSYCKSNPTTAFSVSGNLRANFDNLKSVNISHTPMFKTETLMNFQMSSNCLKLILGSPLLEKIVFREQINLTDKILLDVTNTTKLSCLKTLSLTLCNSITMRSLWNVIRLYNPLESLHLIDCRGITKRDYYNLKRYLSKQKLQVKIDWA